MRNKGKFRNISLDKISANPNVFTKTKDLIVSKHAYSLPENLFDWRHPHLIEGISFTFCTKGNATINLNLSQYKITENMIGIFLPNSVVQVLEQSPDFEIGFLLFSFDFISGFHLTKELGMIAAEVEKQPSFELSEEAFSEVLTLHSFIFRQYEKNASYSIEIVKGLLRSLIFQVLQFYSEMAPLRKEKTKDRHEEVHSQFISLLFQHYKSRRNVSFYAQQLYLTPKYFSKVIKNISGKTAGEWIDEMVIMGAKGMLKSSSLSVAQISDELNFANPSFFGSYFKLKTGYTPLQYRDL